eukprot:522175-Amphidinium_carterae.1
MKKVASPSESFLASGYSGVSKTFSSLASSPELGVRAGRVHAAPAPEGGDEGGDDSPRRDEPRDPWHGE